MSKSLSIVIPVYNEASRLAACLQSIADQSEAPEDVIVIDNNSTDNSLSIAQQFPFVRVIHEKRQGIVYARNAGFDAVQADIIARIDADTVLPANWVAYVKKFYANDGRAMTALTGGGFFYNIRLPRFNGWIQSQFAYRLNRFIVGHYILWGSNMAMPAALWPKVRGKICIRNDIHEDLDLSFHLHESGVKICYREKLRVGVHLKRVYSDRRQLMGHMNLWPQSLKSHGYRLWWLGSLGNVFLGSVMLVVVLALELAAQMFGKKPFNS